MFREMLKTGGMCVVCYFLGLAIVKAFWPALAALEIVKSMPVWLPGKLANYTAFFLFYVITHMERGCITATGYPFLLLYGVACLCFGLSTIHPSQYNEGTASAEMAFVIMLGWKAWQKYRNERLEL